VGSHVARNNRRPIHAHSTGRHDGDRPDISRQRRRHFYVRRLLFRGHPEVVDADLADYFGSIPHAELLQSVTRRIVDRRVLHLIKMWLECPVEETDDRGRKTRTTEARDNRHGGEAVTASCKDRQAAKIAGEAMVRTGGLIQSLRRPERSLELRLGDLTSHRPDEAT
jgi:hypothetical protein